MAGRHRAGRPWFSRCWSRSRCRGAPTPGLTAASSGREAPSISADDLPGRRWTLADGAGRVTWVNFWATSCEPCRTEMPAMQRLADAYGDRLLVLGVDRGSRAASDGLRERYAIGYPILLDPRLVNFSRWSADPACRGTIRGCGRRGRAGGHRPPGAGADGRDRGRAARAASLLARRRGAARGNRAQDPVMLLWIVHTKKWSPAVRAG